MIDKKTERNEIDKMRLYFECADAINEAEESLEYVHKREKETWRERFLANFEPTNWSEKWCCDPSSFGHIYRSEWRCTKEQEQTDDSSAPYRISFVHNIRRQESFKEGLLTLRLYCPPSADSEFRDTFQRQFHNDEKIRNLLEEQGVKQKHGAKDWHTTWERAFDREKLPRSYYKTLRTAFEDHHEIADEITRIFENTLDEIKSE